MTALRPLLVVSTLACLAVAAHAQETIEKHGVTLHKAEGQYVTVYSQNGEEHAHEMAAKTDELFDTWLYRYCGLRPDFRARERDEDKEAYNAAKAAHDEVTRTLKKFPILDRAIAKEARRNLKNRNTLSKKIEATQKKINAASSDATRHSYERKLQKLEDTLRTIHAVRRPPKVLPLEMYEGAEKASEAIGKPRAGYAWKGGRTVVCIRSKEGLTLQTLGHELTHQFLTFYCKSRYQWARGYHWSIECICDFHGFGVALLPYAIRKTQADIRSHRLPALSDLIQNSDIYRRPIESYYTGCFLLFLEQRHPAAYYKLFALVGGDSTDRQSPVDTLEGLLKYTRIALTPDEIEKEFHNFILAR